MKQLFYKEHYEEDVAVVTAGPIPIAGVAVGSWNAGRCDACKGLGTLSATTVNDILKNMRLRRLQIVSRRTFNYLVIAFFLAILFLLSLEMWVTIWTWIAVIVILFVVFIVVRARNRRSSPLHLDTARVKKHDVW